MHVIIVYETISKINTFSLDPLYHLFKKYRNATCHVLETTINEKSRGNFKVSCGKSATRSPKINGFRHLQKHGGCIVYRQQRKFILNKSDSPLIVANNKKGSE